MILALVLSVPAAWQSSPGGSATSGPIALPADCVSSLRDQADPSRCIGASSVPVPGMLLPLGTLLFVDPFGCVGIGTSTPLARLHVAGSARAEGGVQAGFGSASQPSFEFGDGAEETGFSSPAFQEIVVSTAGSERLVFQADGRTRLGPPSVSFAPFKLEVRATAADPWSGAILGRSAGNFGYGVFGLGEAQGGIGVLGQTNSGSGFGVYSAGNLAATGTKSFVQPHPSDSRKEVRFVCLEGNESGTYFRGSARLVDGRCVIPVPEAFRLVTEPSGITVQLTPIGTLTLLCAESFDLDRIVVRGQADCEFHYFVNGVRRGFADLEPIEENRSFVPAVRGEPFGTQYPEALRRILVENGTLNPDFTPNEATALRNGWELASPAALDPPARRR